MATRYIYYNPSGMNFDIGGDGVAEDGYNIGQSIRVGEGEGNTLYSIKFKAIRIGVPGLLHVAVRLSDGTDLPLGENLSIGTYDCSGISDDEENPSEIEVIMSPPIQLTLEQYVYAIVFGLPWSESEGGTVRFGNKYSLLDIYPAGKLLWRQEDLSWIADIDYDFWFEEWGNPTISWMPKLFYG